MLELSIVTSQTVSAVGRVPVLAWLAADGIALVRL